MALEPSQWLFDSFQSAQCDSRKRKKRRSNIGETQCSTFSTPNNVKTINGVDTAATGALKPLKGSPNVDMGEPISRPAGGQRRPDSALPSSPISPSPPLQRAPSSPLTSRHLLSKRRASEGGDDRPLSGVVACHSNDHFKIGNSLTNDAQSRHRVIGPIPQGKHADLSKRHSNSAAFTHSPSPSPSQCPYSDRGDDVKSLPVFSSSDEIITAVRRHRVTIVVGQTGCGKTTQVPQLILDHVLSENRNGDQSMGLRGATGSTAPAAVIAVTQPRRVAAMSLANRVAVERHGSVGGEVGYHIRFENVTTPKTRIKFMTDGVLIREAMRDKELSRYQVIILDEAHERTIRTDILIGLLSSILFRRKDLRLVIMSATLEHRIFVDYFSRRCPQPAHRGVAVADGRVGELKESNKLALQSQLKCPVVTIPGRQYPVRECYLEAAQDDVIEAAFTTIMQIHLTRGRGDILVFLSGQEAIEALARKLAEVHANIRHARALIPSLLSTHPGSPPLATATPTVAPPPPPPAALTTVATPADTAQAEWRRPFTVKATVGDGVYTLDGAARSERKGTDWVMDVSGGCATPEVFSDEEGGEGESHYLDIQQEQQYLPDGSEGGNCELLELLDLNVVPLFASLPFERQKKVFEKTRKACRKIVLATNIAETSLTISGVRFVVDTGKVKLRQYDPTTGVEVLSEVAVSKAMARQRCGRAGREQAGEAFRVFTEQDFLLLEEHILPEIRRSDLCQVVLELTAIGVSQVKDFPWITPPVPQAVDKAVKTLVMMGAIEKSTYKLTERGTRMSQLPMTPILANLILFSVEFGCLNEIMVIVSMLTAEAFLHTMRDNDYQAHSLTNDRASQERMGVLGGACRPTGGQKGVGSGARVSSVARKRVMSPDGDHLTLFNIFELWSKNNDKKGFCDILGLDERRLQQAESIQRQLKAVLESQLSIGRMPMCEDATRSLTVRQCLTKALFLNVAKLDRDGSHYVTEVDRNVVSIHPSSTMFGISNKPMFVLFHEMVSTTSEVTVKGTATAAALSRQHEKVYLRQVTPIDEAWLAQLHPSRFGRDETQKQNRATTTTPSKIHIHNFQHPNIVTKMPSYHGNRFVRSKSMQ